MNAKSCVSAEFYEERARQHGLLRDGFARRSLYISNFRGLVFVVFAGAASLSFYHHAGKLGISIVIVGLATFVFLVARHAKIIDAQDLEASWVRVNEDAVARVKFGAWHALPQTGERFRDPTHAYADDLDVFGRGSLFQRICVAQTHIGQTRLFELLNAPTEHLDLIQRQTAVRALAPQLEFRQTLEVLGLGTRNTSKNGQGLAEPSDLAPLLTWGQSVGHVKRNRRFVAVAWALPLLTALSCLLGYLGILPVSLAIAPLAIHLIALLKARPHTQELIRMLTRTERIVEKAGRLFELLEGKGDLDWLQQRLKAGPESPSLALIALSRIGSWFELRHNGLVYPFVNVVLLWDIHCLLGFERWRARFGSNLRQWFDTLGEVEALSSLAGLYHDEPDSCFAEIVDKGCGFEAMSLGHVLIHPTERITNDVAGLHPGHGLLVTGSNMSGKSTYLRAIGLASVLGLAGGPVCAKRLRITQLNIATSMRISDSLANGVSHFYAELQKLRRVIEVTRGRRPVLFLLDEILHGTNSRERQIGARYVLAELLRAGAFGAVSTHDSALCELSDELATRLALVHFRESVVGDEMTFDYRLYPGPVTSGNALRLMQKLGIPVPLEAD